MELYQLKSLVVVADEGSLTRGAERLHASLPAVSAHIRSLEEELGVELFKRTSRGMKTTRAGTMILPLARTMLATAEDIKATAQMLLGRVTGEAVIGLNTDSEFLRVTEIIDKVFKSHPQLKLGLVQSSSDKVIRDIRNSELDAGFVFYGTPFNDIDAIALNTCRLRVVAPAAWQDKVQGKSPEELLQLPWVWPASHCPFRSILAENDDIFPKDPEERIVVDHEDIIRRLVVTGRGISIMREDEAEEELQAGTVVYCLEDYTLTTNIYFAYLKSRAEEPLIKALIKTVKSVWNVE